MIDLSNVPLTALLAEIDRRRAKSKPVPVYFFGVWPGSGRGHHMRGVGGFNGEEAYKAFDSVTKAMRAMGRNFGLYPWDGHDYQANRNRPEIQGEFHTWRGCGWTVITCWDRVEDNRAGCSTAFVVEDDVTAQNLLDTAQKQFPRVFARMKAAGIETVLV